MEKKQRRREKRKESKRDRRCRVRLVGDVGRWGSEAEEMRHGGLASREERGVNSWPGANFCVEFFGCKARVQRQHIVTSSLVASNSLLAHYPFFTF